MTPDAQPTPASRETPDSVPDPAPESAAAPRARVEDKAPRGLWFRLLVYVVLVHAFAAFLFLLFEVAARQ
ncbi:hypothetical protein GCM10027160_06480 [Streptomyces calidiresistens]|uniref:Small hydrophobic protein n=1 Tax=Streptomyces calidiresistens TaxID=1485586 RepID=A0A7W3T629_9ACTN|nr:DUF6126 family protein [Streptomyces calidiresistens]MBB0231633.1 hypothetical protein [Streptomyces calidiresistens]